MPSRIPKDTQYINLYIKKYLHAKLVGIAKDNDVSFSFLVKRALIAVAESGVIPTPSKGYLEALSREKYGEEAVPTFDVEERAPSQSRTNARRGPVQQPE